MTWIPLIHVWILGGFPSMRARSSFQSPAFQSPRFHWSGVNGQGNVG